MADIFSIVPVEVWLDDRLSKTDLRVLGAILSFRNKNTNLCWPKRSQLSERCGLPETRISTTTSNLVKLGCLKKEGTGGFSRSCTYTFMVPETVTALVTVTDSVTVTEPVTRVVTESVTNTVTEPVTRNKQTNKLTIQQTIKDICETSENMRFKKPTLQDITDYQKEIGFKNEASKFLNYYESNGWRVGKNPMKNWKAAFSGWCDRSNNFSANKQTGPSEAEWSNADFMIDPGSDEPPLHLYNFIEHDEET